MSNDYKEDDLVDAILWGVMKMLIGASSIKYAKEQKAKQKRIEKTLETEIVMLERKLESNISEAEKREFPTELSTHKDLCS